jgi:hypothetical protein
VIGHPFSDGSESSGFTGVQRVEMLSKIGVSGEHSHAFAIDPRVAVAANAVRRPIVALGGHLYRGRCIPGRP